MASGGMKTQLYPQAPLHLLELSGLAEAFDLKFPPTNDGGGASGSLIRTQRTPADEFASSRH